jgi:signal transduction histidine kinase
VVDRVGHISVFNRRFAEMWGLSTSLAGPVDDCAALAAVMVHLRDPDAFLARVRALYDAPTVESYDVIELRDGRIFERYSQPQRLGRRLVGRVWSFRDVTERRCAEDERDALLVQEQEARAAAEQAVRARDEFFTAVSHELKTPLTSLVLVVQHLLQEAPRDEAPRAPRPALAIVERQAARLTALADMLLDVSRIQAGRLELRREPLDLAELTRAVACRVRGPAAVAGSELRLALGEPVRGVWDRARVEQALGGLLTNAIKYGEGRPIDVGCARVGERAVITVRDRGVGIAPASFQRIFERFERASSVRHYGGLGLGLYFARTIVEAHGGTIGVESAPGEGATFTLELPIGAQAAAA